MDRKDKAPLSYIPKKISLATAQAIAVQMLEAIGDLLAVYARHMDTEIEDYDAWYGISSNWDVNINNGDAGSKLCATLYPVIDGHVDTSMWYTIDN